MLRRDRLFRLGVCCQNSISPTGQSTHMVVTAISLESPRWALKVINQGNLSNSLARQVGSIQKDGTL